MPITSPNYGQIILVKTAAAYQTMDHISGSVDQHEIDRHAQPIETRFQQLWPIHNLVSESVAEAD